MIITPELIEQHQLTTAEYKKIVTLLGREASLRVLDRPETDWMFPDTPVRPVRIKAFATPLLTGMLVAARGLDALDLRRPR